MIASCIVGQMKRVENHHCLIDELR